MFANNAFSRIQTFRVLERYSEVMPGVWDVADKTQPTISEVANKFIEENSVEVVPPAYYHVGLAETSQNGTSRIYQHLLTIVYRPKEIISDGRQKETQVSQTDVSGGKPTIGGGDAGTAIGAVERILEQLRSAGVGVQRIG